MRTRKLGLSLAALMFVSPFAACSGDDDPDGDGNGSGNGSESGSDGGSGDVAGPEEPSTLIPECPFTAKQLGKELGLALNEKNCVFTGTQKDSPVRISVTTAPSAGNEGFEQQLASVEESWDQVEELDVSGQGFAAWTEDELNTQVGYLDNVGEYRIAISALPPADAEAESVVELAEDIVDLVVKARPDTFPTEVPESEDEDPASEDKDDGNGGKSKNDDED